MITVWITKYALTTGIMTEQVEEPTQRSPNMICARALGPSAFFHGKDWHRTKEAAATRAEEMRKTKLASLKKQIIKLERLNWGVFADD